MQAWEPTTKCVFTTTIWLLCSHSRGRPFVFFLGWPTSISKWAYPRC
jgi:hypothetical protein